MSDEAPFDFAAACARLEADHAAVVHHATAIALTLDWLAGMILVLEPTAGPAEAWLAGVVGTLVATATLIPPLGALASIVTLAVEHGADGGLKAWALARVNAVQG